MSSLLSGISYTKNDNRQALIANTIAEADKRKREDRKASKKQKKKSKKRIYDSNSDSDSDSDSNKKIKKHKKKKKNSYSSSSSSSDSDCDGDVNIRSKSSTAFQSDREVTDFITANNMTALLREIKQDNENDSGEDDIYKLRYNEDHDTSSNRASQKQYSKSSNYTVASAGETTTAATVAAAVVTTNKQAAHSFKQLLLKSKGALPAVPIAGTLVTTAAATSAQQELQLDDVLRLKALNNLRNIRGHSSSSSGGGREEEATIKELVAQERLKDANDDMDNIYASNVLRLGNRYKGSDINISSRSGIDEEEDIDVSLYQHSSNGNNVDMMRKSILKTLSNREKMNKAINRCSRCLDSSCINNSITITYGLHCMLRLKVMSQSVANYHIEIVPYQHCTSIIACSEETSTEIELYKASLQAYYRQLKMFCVFSETAISKTSSTHAHIDVIPLKKEFLSDVPMYFKEAMSSCSDDYTSYQRVIHLSREARLYNALPKKGCSYVFVEYAEDCKGFVYVIDDCDGSRMSNNFCLEVVAGMLNKVYRTKDSDNAGCSAVDEEATRVFREKYKHFAPIKHNCSGDSSSSSSGSRHT